MATRNKLLQRYRRLTLWNRIGVWGAVASILGLVLTVVLQIWLTPSPEQTREAENRLAARITEGTGAAGQLDAIRKELERRGASPPEETVSPEGARPDIKRQIRDAIQRLPEEIRAKQKEEVDALIHESKAQALAQQIDKEFRPQLLDVIELIDEVVAKAIAAGLIDLEGKTEQLKLPAQLAYTTFVMSKHSLHAEQPGHSMSFRFKDGVVWVVFLQLGMVRSSSVLAKGWDAPTDKYYPMLRIKRQQKGREMPLATIWFHQDSKALRVELSSRHELPQSTRDSIEVLEQESNGADLISGALIELLKTERLKSRGGA